MKLLIGLVSTATLCGFLSACDSTAPKTVTKIQYDTIWTDRFANDKAVLYGEWTMTTSTDTADAFFFQDSNRVTAYVPWKHATSWTLSGTLTADSVNMNNGASLPLYFYGKFTKTTPTGNKSQSLMVNEIKGSYFDAAHPSGALPTWTAVRKI